ncbi:Hypothetical predicted protein [Paramuricea clavata]|uniref:Uncharacterized protein n=1 Tax=Paramuricea clavata TaxID=317549 RepID=A0A7D9M815_PARCT|nr:Hypothetical predicted protein [Paramuricea clavata]
MSLRYKVVLVWVTCLSCKVIMTGCEVVLVNRNVTDSFRVGNDGCTNDATVCTSSATCQSDGSCLCSDSKPNFRNPVIIADGAIKYGDSYGCVSSEFMRSGVGVNVCSFKPFQVIPHSPKDEAIQFSYDLRNTIFQKCSLEKAVAKFPDNVAEMDLQWLNESYIDLTVSSKTLYFNWTRSATDLQGTIITFTLKCQLSSGGYSTECLRAKVLGIWTAGKGYLPNTPSFFRVFADSCFAIKNCQ